MHLLSAAHFVNDRSRPSTGEDRMRHAKTLVLALSAIGAASANGCGADDDARGPQVGQAVAPLIVAELTLQNGWTNAPFSTRNAGFSISSGVVHLEGAIAGGSSPLAFTLPGGFRPASNVYVSVDLCNANKGRLLIAPSGDASIQ